MEVAFLPESGRSDTGDEATGTFDFDDEDCPA
jgi:hypothetical protein